LTTIFSEHIHLIFALPAPHFEKIHTILGYGIKHHEITATAGALECFTISILCSFSHIPGIQYFAAYYNDNPKKAREDRNCQEKRFMLDKLMQLLLSFVIFEEKYRLELMEPIADALLAVILAHKVLLLLLCIFYFLFLL